MKILEIEIIENLNGGSVAPDCNAMFASYAGFVGDQNYNAAYGVVIQMNRFGCSMNPYTY